MSGPLISVVIPTFNGGAYLGEALESVVAQARSDVEIVVVDDASTDDTPAWISRFAGRGVRSLRHAENKGISAAVNTAMQHVQGEFVAFLDHDDLWLPGKLDTQLALFTAAPGIDIAFTDYVEFGEGARPGTAFSERNEAMRRYPRRRVADDSFAILSESFLLDFLRIQAAPMPSTTMYRTAKLREALPLDEDVAHQDVQITFRLANQAVFGYVDRPLVKRRIHGANWGSVMGKLRWLESHIKTLQRLPRWASLTEEERSAVQRMLGNYLRAAGYTSFTSGALAQARAFYGESLRRDFRPEALLYWFSSWLPAKAVSRLRRMKQKIAAN